MLCYILQNLSIVPQTLGSDHVARDIKTLFLFMTMTHTSRPAAFVRAFTYMFVRTGREHTSDHSVNFHGVKERMKSPGIKQLELPVLW